MVAESRTLPVSHHRRQHCYRQPPVAFHHDLADLAGGLVPGLARAPAADPGLAFDSARSALRFALEHLHRLQPERRRVVVSAYTCWSVAAAIEYAGLEPVCCDLDPHTLDLAPPALTECLQTPPLAIIATHLLGVAPAASTCGGADADTWRIEDAAQAADPAGAALPGFDLRLISTARGKPLSTAGGGFLQLLAPARLPDLAAAWSALPSAGTGAGPVAVARALVMRVLSHPRLFWLPAAVPGLQVGTTHYPHAITPVRLSSCQRRLYARASRHLPRLRALRRTHAGFYARAVEGLLSAPQPAATRAPDFAPYRFPVYLDRPWSALSAAARRTATRVGIARMYPCALTGLERVQCRPANTGRSAPGAEWIAAHLVTLPAHAGIGERERGDVVAALATIARETPHVHV